LRQKHRITNLNTGASLLPRSALCDVDGIGRLAFSLKCIAGNRRDARFGAGFSDGLPSILGAEGRRGRLKTQGEHRKLWNKQGERFHTVNLDQKTWPAFGGVTRGKYKRIAHK
jgi:hypothetical protein